MVPFFQNWSVGTLAHYFSGPVKSGGWGRGGVLDQYLGMGEPLRVGNPDHLANQINTNTLSSGTSPRIGHIKEYPPPPPRKSSQNVLASQETLSIVLGYVIFTFHIVESVL